MKKVCAFRCVPLIAFTKINFQIIYKILEKLFETDVNTSTDGAAGEKGTRLGLIICKDFY